MIKYETMIISQPPSANDLERLAPWECFSIVPWQGEYLLYLKRKIEVEEVRRILQDLHRWAETEQLQQSRVRPHFQRWRAAE